MVMEAFNWYVETLTAYWGALAGGGLLRLILIGCIIYWVCNGPMRWRCHCHHRRHRRRHRCRCRCQHCGCRCGHCPCDAGEDGGDKSEKAKSK
jgi:hypothetical protein